MNPDKRIIIDDLTARANASPFLIVVDYTSITVPEFTNLRSALAACGAQCHVAKNNFMRTALTDAGLPDIGEHLVGQTAFVTGASDVAAAAKAINTFAKASKKAEYKVAILDGAILSADDIRAIGELPPRDQLLAKLLDVIADNAVVDVHIALVVEHIEGAGYIDFKGRSDILGFLFLLFPKQVI